MRKSIIVLVILLLAGGGGYGYYVYTKKDPPPTVTTGKITRGDVAETVGATGILQAVTTVQVGTQVSGTVMQLNADFNTLVHKGQVIARLDPSLFQTQIDQAKANLVRAQADLQRFKVAVDDSTNKLKRAKDLFAKGLIPQTDLETAQVTLDSANAQLLSQQAAVTQANASLQQNVVNLEHTVIQAPIDGLVISRNVDVGQTVASSLSAPTLFILAADLTKMQVVASLDESDVGRIRPGQVVHFRVDAYPTQQFNGTVTQVRLQPQTVQNVVTYNTVIDVPNPELKLKPGMTANVNVEIARTTNVLRVPNAALRFRPTNETFIALGQTPPAAPAGGGRGGRGRGGNGGATDGTAPPATDSRAGQSQQPATAASAATAAPPATGAPVPPAGTQDRPQGRRRNADQGAPGSPAAGTDAANSQPGAGGGRGGGGGGRGNMQERMASMTPEQRQAFMDRMRARGIDPTTMGQGRGGGRQGGSGQTASAAVQRGGRTAGPGVPKPAAAGASAATTIDALFAPLPPTQTFGQVWIFQEGKLSRVPLRLGVSDGQQSALLQGDLKEDEDVVTSVLTAAQKAATAAAGATAPLFGPQQRGGGGGFPGGGGGGRGGGR